MLWLATWPRERRTVWEISLTPWSDSPSKLVRPFSFPLPSDLFTRPTAPSLHPVLTPKTKLATSSRVPSSSPSSWPPPSFPLTFGLRPLHLLSVWAGLASRFSSALPRSLSRRCPTGKRSWIFASECDCSNLGWALTLTFFGSQLHLLWRPHQRSAHSPPTPRLRSLVQPHPPSSSPSHGSARQGRSLQNGARSRGHRDCRWRRGQSRRARRTDR